MKKLGIYLILIIVMAYHQEVFAKKKNSMPRVAPKENEAIAPGKREEGDFIVEKKADGSVVKYKKKTTYDFEGANIEGLYNKPSGSYISNIKDVKGKSIIRVRENFDAEVTDSARLIK